MEIKVFNTGRQYSDKGQRIAYVLIGEVVYFVDVDREIDGEIVKSIYLPVTDAWVLGRYDAGNYTSGSKWFYETLGRELLDAALNL